jgi:transcriptional regulator with XRE-family HTH domain
MLRVIDELKNMGFAEERLVAEQALAVYELGSPAEPVFPSVAARILRAREALGLTKDDVAARWGEQPSMYWDLEFFDDEAFTVISVKQLQRLAAVLETSVSALLFSEEPPPEFPGASYAEVTAKLRKKIAEEAISLEHLGDQIGWELGPLLDDPDALGDLPIDGLRSVCQAVGVDWVAALRTLPDNGLPAGR